MNFFGLLTFQAPYLPWVLLAFSIILGSSTVVDIIGIVVGHFYYFFEDVFPNEEHGFRILETPRFIKLIFDWLEVDEQPIHEADRPEQFNFANEANHQNLIDPVPESNATGTTQPDSTSNIDHPHDQEQFDSQTPINQVDEGSRTEQESELRARNVSRQPTQET